MGRVKYAPGVFCCLILAACGGEGEQGPQDLPFAGGRLDGALDGASADAGREDFPAAATQAESSKPKQRVDQETGLPLVTWNDLRLPDERVDDLVDALLYPESYSEEEKAFPTYIAELDGQEVIIEGFMIPLEWEGERVLNFMLVGDMLACCFGGAPEPDAWIDVKMNGEGAEYFVQLPILVRGIIHIEGLDDGTGYAAGCYTMQATSIELSE